MLQDLKAAGLDSIPGGGAEILVERVRRLIAPKKATTEEWLEVFRQWAGLGGKGTATMMFGHVETDAERIEHLQRIRELQDECRVFTAFIPWTFQPEHTPLGTTLLTPRGGHKATVAEYLRTLSLARLYLQNVPHLQSSFVTQGMKICQVGLSMGADDFGSGDARGERRQRRRLRASDLDPGDRTPHQGRRLRAAAAQHAGTSRWRRRRPTSSAGR